MDFTAEMQKLGFTKEQDNLWVKPDVAKVKINSSSNIKVVTEAESIVFCHLDTEERVISFLKQKI
jgi:hypothetical protein